jgi:peptidoglycan hydrolase-like protein with peptidoglycan-binding domain
MSRPLFGVGAQGSLIVRLQTALTTRGFDPRGTDGLYGKDTAAAVRQFQVSIAQPATGIVTDDQWSAVTGSPAPDIEARCLQLTSTFEGHGFGLAEGNWDGAWLTWGIVGFTLKNGDIQRIIGNLRRRGSPSIEAAFGPDTGQLLEIIQAPVARQEAWATNLTIGARLAEPWRTYFREFGSYDDVQAEQIARVHEDYFVPAARTAASLGLLSELGVALCFDIHVQNGGVSVSGRDAVRAAAAGNELVQREALANAVADHAKAQFREDVRARKLAIARGRGDVHSRHVELATWGLTDVPAVVA